MAKLVERIQCTTPRTNNLLNIKVVQPLNIKQELMYMLDVSIACHKDCEF